jgi:hypothetical protein
MESDDYISIYNRTELFALNKTKKPYSLIEQPQSRSFGSLYFFFNSIQTLRSVLEQLTESDTITKHQLNVILIYKTGKVIYAGEFDHGLIEQPYQSKSVISFPKSLPPSTPLKNLKIE